MDLSELERRGENVVVDAQGTEVSPGPSIEADRGGRIDFAPDGCAVTFVHCRTKKTVIQSLRPGETFGYGDWDGTHCVWKSFTC